MKNYRGDLVEESVNEQLKKQFQEQQKNHHNPNIYIEAALKGIGKLEQMISFIKRVEKEPEIVFTSIKNEMGDTRHNYFSVIKNFEVNGKKLLPHDFQKFLLEKLNEGLKKLVKEQGIKDGYRFVLSSPNTFPTKYQLFFKEKHICRVDIINKLYGEADVYNEEYFLKLKEEKESYIQEIKTEILTYQEIKRNPYKEIKTFVEIPIVLFKRKKLKKLIDEKLETLNKKLSNEKENLKKMENEVPIIRNKNMDTQDLFEQFEPLFIKYGYSFTEEKSKLY